MVRVNLTSISQRTPFQYLLCLLFWDGKVKRDKWRCTPTKPTSWTCHFAAAKNVCYATYEYILQIGSTLHLKPWLIKGGGGCCKLAYFKSWKELQFIRFTLICLAPAADYKQWCYYMQSTRCSISKHKRGRSMVMTFPFLQYQSNVTVLNCYLL